MSEDTKKILQKFYVTLRNNVNATAIYREVWGLTQFDRELITAQRTNTEAVDKLVDIVGSRSTRSFVSFVDALKKHDHTEIADTILAEAKQNYPQIHRVLGTVLVLPTATVPPSSNMQSNPTTKCVDNQAYNNSQTKPNPRNDQNNIRYAQNEATGSQDTEESDSENESSVLTLDTRLSQIAYEDVMLWVEELSENKQWKKLATKMKLNYQTVKDLEKEKDPVDTFFHQHCSNLTIKRFLNYLTKASLTSIVSMVRKRMDESDDDSGFQQTTLQEEVNNAPFPAELPNDKHAIVQQMNFLNPDDSITDNTQIACNDKTSSPPISKRTNIGSMSNNDTSLNIAKVDNLTMIYTIQAKTESSLSDKDVSMQSAEIEKNISVDDNDVNNRRQSEQRFGNEFPYTVVPDNMQSREQLPPLQELNIRENAILAEPENIKEKYNDQWCENLLDEGRIHEKSEYKSLSSSLPTKAVAKQLLHMQLENTDKKAKKHPEQDCNEMLMDAGIQRSDNTYRNIQDSMPNADSVVE
ncbi:unnamed protein product [Mytilus coruscus]|uniref:Caspase recruitment domain-containing protein n=1 Tax=Mytilus coruscus TaxID=42192 RepID=A0A6J8B8H5_MYTCO|nr:unnamed protein product [Mytilus coruscus]